MVDHNVLFSKMLGEIRMCDRGFTLQFKKILTSAQPPYLDFVYDFTNELIIISFIIIECYLSGSHIFSES